MKKTLILMLCWAMVGVVLAQNHTKTDPQVAKNSICKPIACGHLAFINPKNNIAFTQTSASNYGFNVVFQRLELDLNPEIRYIKGKITTHFKIEENALNRLLFDVSDSLQITNIRFRHQDLTQFSRQNNQITIELNTTINPNFLDSITISYQGTPPKTEGFGSFTIGKHGVDSTAALWTLSQPYGARDWWICKQTLTDKIDSIDVIIHCPKRYKAIAIGMKKSEQVIDNKRITHWKHRYPVATYLVAVAVSEYTYFEENATFNNTNLTLVNYAYAEDSLEASGFVPLRKATMQLFFDHFGTYPFARELYGETQFGWGGGMEHQTMSSIGAYSYELMSHELAHQWFGNKVTCGSWQDISVNEGFATYATGLGYEQLFEGKFWGLWKRLVKDLLIKNTQTGSVFVQDTSSIERLFSGSLTYYKGAWVLHQLRYIVGDEAFFEALKNYLNDVNLSYKFATFEHLKYHLEQASRTNLTSYFNQWIYGEGYPLLRFECQKFNNNKTIIVNTSQTTTKPSSIKHFDLRLPICFYGKSRQDSSIRYIENEGYRHAIFDLPFEVDSIGFDPQRWVLAKDTVVYKSTPNDIFFKVYPTLLDQNTPQITLIYEAQTTTKISIVDVLGKIIWEQTIPYDKKVLKQIGVEMLSSGVYVVLVYDLGKRLIYSQKIVKD